MKKICSFLITLGLIASMVGCGTTPARYNLTMAANPVEGGTATDLTDSSPYAAGTAVSIEAVADAGYQFVEWTAPAGGFADSTVAETTFTMPAQDVTVTANFAVGAIGIYDWYDLSAVSDNPYGSYLLMNDLDSATAGYAELAGPTANGGEGWQPIGGFAGTFSGHGHEIGDLFINRPGEDQVGLFGYVGGGVIEGVGVTDAMVAGHEYVGGLIGFNLGTVRDSYSTASVVGEHHVGGLMGSCQSGNTVSNSYYNYDEGLINGEETITIGALYDQDFEQWLANGGFLDVNERLSQEDGYYLIDDINDFKELLAFGQNSSLKFRLASDLDLVDLPNFYIPYLAGEFDGSGHKISNLNLNSNNLSQVGLFGFLASGGRVTGVGVENVNITAYKYAGGLAGCNYEGTVSNSYSTGNVCGYESVGNLIGVNDGTVSNSYATGNVTGMNFVGILVGWNLDDGLVINCYSTGGNTAGNSVGGVVGQNRGTVTYSYSTGGVAGDYIVGGVVGSNTYGTVTYSYSTGSVTGSEKVGGVVGYNSGGSVSNSYSVAEVTGYLGVGGLVGQNNEATVADCCFVGTVTGEGQIGGLVGDNRGPVHHCYSAGDVTGLARVGGLVGDNRGTVESSYVTGSVTGWNIVGGLVGDDTAGTIENSFAIGSVTAELRAGGLVGSCFMSTVSNCYAAGNVVGTGSYVLIGGLVGVNDSGTINNSFWDTETSGQSESAGGTGKTTAEMKDITTFTDTETEGLDEPWSIFAVADPSTRNLTYIWNIVGHVTYPFLSWQP